MRHAALASLTTSTLLVVAGCGAATPSEANIYYDPALRPGVAETSEAERELLARLGELEAEQAVEIAGRVYVAEVAYDAASGRRCRPVRVREGAVEQARLACEAESGWVFVPDVLLGGEPQ